MNTSTAIAPSSFSMEALLGGKKTLRTQPRTALDWIAVIRAGLSSKALDSLLNMVRVSQAELAAALDIPARTLARRKKDGVLNREESSKLVRLARVVERAGEVFEDIDAGLAWLKSPNAALGGATPLSLLDTGIGADSVLDTLGRIEHGVFA